MPLWAFAKPARVNSAGAGCAGVLNKVFKAVGAFRLASTRVVSVAQGACVFRLPHGGLWARAYFVCQCLKVLAFDPVGWVLAFAGMTSKS